MRAILIIGFATLCGYGAYLVVSLIATNLGWH